MKFRNLAWLLILVIVGCSSDDDETPELTPQAGAQIIIGNQGGFLATNASITLYNQDSGETTQDLYAAANDGDVIGDVLQSMYLYNDELYVVMNNSSKIEVLDPSTFANKRTIQGLTSPRYIEFISSEKAYVSDIASSSINIIDPTAGTNLGAISTGFWVEEMVQIDGKVWCTAPGENKVIIIDISTNEITEEIALTANANDILLDANNDVWVLCQGSFSEPFIEPTIYRIDPASMMVEETLTYPTGTGFGGNIEISHTGLELYVLVQGSVSKMNITATELPSETFISRANQSLYGISIDQESGDIFVSDAGDFAQDGMSYVYDSEGELKYEIEAGIVPWTAVWN